MIIRGDQVTRSQHGHLIDEGRQQQMRRPRMGVDEDSDRYLEVLLVACDHDSNSWSN